MNFNVVRAGASLLPFFLKHSLASIFICTIIGGFNVFANDVEQTRADDVKQLIKQAEKFSKKGNQTEAEKLLRRAIELDPKHSTAKLNLAYLLVKQRRLHEAYDLSFPVAKDEPKNSYAFAVLGATLLSAGKFDEAKIVFYNAIQLNKRQALAWAGFGMLDFYENRINDSMDNLQEAVFHDPEEEDYQFALAQVSARAERYREAAEAYKRFLSISQNTDDERRARIKGLINFLNFLGQKSSLYSTGGEQQTSVGFKLVGNRPIIQIKVNEGEEPLNFVLDTGSGISVISDKTAKRMKIRPITRGGFAKGIGGDGKFEIVYGFLRQVDIGAVKVRNVPVYIRKFHGDNEAIDGYIGLSLISKFLTTIDYGELKFSLIKKDNSQPIMPDGEALSLPLRLTSSGFLSGQVQLEGLEATLNFIVDTGASVSVISDDLASTQEVSQFVKGDRMRVVGSAGVTEDVASFMLPRVTFGRHSRQSIVAIALDLDLINEASGFEQSGILGGNFLRNYRLTFDFKNSKVTFVPINQDGK